MLIYQTFSSTSYTSYTISAYMSHAREDIYFCYFLKKV